MEAIDTILREELETLKTSISNNMRAAGQVASGRTLASMNVVVGDNEGTLYGGLPDGAPIGTFETGRRAGAVPADFPAVILEWMNVKGIQAEPIPYVRQPSERWQPKYSPQERGQRALAGAIAQKIETQGTKLYREGGRSDIYTPEIDKTVNRISDRIMMGMELEIDSINSKL